IWHRTTDRPDPSEYLRMTFLSLRNCACMLLLVLLAADAEREHEFIYKPDGKPSRVNIAGSFNNWSTDATPMTADADGTFRAKVKLPEGVHHYKFVVDGKDWKPDPNSDKDLQEGDNFGGFNSGVMIGPDARKAPPAKPNAINPDYITFAPISRADLTAVSTT